MAETLGGAGAEMAQSLGGAEVGEGLQQFQDNIGDVLNNVLDPDALQEMEENIGRAFGAGSDTMDSDESLNLSDDESTDEEDEQLEKMKKRMINQLNKGKGGYNEDSDQAADTHQLKQKCVYIID